LAAPRHFIYVFFVAAETLRPSTQGLPMMALPIELERLLHLGGLPGLALWELDQQR